MISLNRLIRNLLVFSPLVIPFSALPVFGVGGVHLTISRFFFLMIFLLYIFNAIASGRMERPQFFGRMIIAALFLYGFLLFFSGFWSHDLVRGFSYTVFYCIFLFFIFVFVSSPLSDSDISRFFDVWILGSFLVLVMCFFEVYFGYRFPGSRYLNDESLSYFRPTATFGNENDLAIYLAISSIFFWGKLKVSQGFLRLFLPAMFVYLVMVVFLTASRGAVLLVLCGLFLNIVLARKRVFGVGLLVDVLILFVGFLIFLILGGWEILFPSFEGLYTTFQKGDERTKLMSIAFNAMGENFYFGVGAGGVENYISKYSYISVENVHNWIGEVLANTGILGGFVWFLVLFSMLILGFRLFKLGDIWFKSLFVVFLTFPIWQSIVSSLIQYSVFWLFIAVFLKKSDLLCSRLSERGKLNV